jgi:hypothetical protein
MGKGCCGGFGGGGGLRDRCSLGSLDSPLTADIFAADMALATTYRNHSVYGNS